MSVEQAREMARQLLLKVRSGSSVASLRTRSTATLLDAYSAYEKGWLIDLSAAWSAKVGRAFRARLLPALGDRLLPEIEAEDIVRAVLDASASAFTRRADFYAMSAMLSWAADHGWLKRNVLRGVRPPLAASRRPRKLSLESLAAIWRASGELRTNWSIAYRLILLTGLTSTAVLGLRRSMLGWQASENLSDLDCDASVRPLGEALGRVALEQIGALGGGGDHLFSGRENGTQLRFQQGIIRELRDRAGVGDFTCRDIQNAVRFQRATWRLSADDWATRLLAAADELDRSSLDEVDL